MIPPQGTYLAKARNGAIQLPAAIRSFCEVSEWTLFHLSPIDEWRIAAKPVLPGDSSEAEFHSSLSPEGILWIPAGIRSEVALGEQSVMVRVEDGEIRIYLRRVFETLGFRP